MQVRVLERGLQLDGFHPFVILTCRLVDLEEAIFNAVLWDLEAKPVTKGPMGATLNKCQEILNDGEDNSLDFIPLTGGESRILRHHQELLQFLADHCQDVGKIFQVLDLLCFLLQKLCLSQDLLLLYNIGVTPSITPLEYELAALSFGGHQVESQRESLLEFLNSIQIGPSLL